jgi:hypothetical protein
MSTRNLPAAVKRGRRVRLVTSPPSVSLLSRNCVILTNLYASTAFYRDNFTSLYVDDVHTSQETHVWASTACYEDSFTFYMWIIFVPHRKHISMVCYSDNFTLLYVYDVRA